VEDLDLISLLYGHFKKEREEHRREPGVYWVTDLVSCSLKERFSRMYPELELAQLFKPILIQGTLIHMGLEALLKEVLEAEGARVEVEKEGSIEVDMSGIIPGAGKVTVKGRVDLALELPESRRFGVEVKSSRGDSPLPLEHHVDQVRIYNSMFGFEASYLLYVTPERIAQYEVRGRMEEDEVMKRIAEPKAPRYTWECRYCPFSVLCPSKVVK